MSPERVAASSTVPNLILVFRPGALGDTLVTADALGALRLAQPSATIELVGNAPAGALLQDARLVDRVVSFDSREVTDLFVEPPRLAARWRSGRLAILWLARTDRLALAFREAGYQVIAAHPEPIDAHHHISDHLQDILVRAGAIPARLETPVALRRETPGPAAGDHQLLVHPGSGSTGKNWSPERFAELIAAAQNLGLVPSILSGPADGAAVAALRGLISPSIPVVSPPTLPGLVDTLLRANALVANDSGVAHLGARLGVPTVAIFGTTDPRRWTPRGLRVIALGSPGHWPSPAAVMRNLARLLDPPGDASIRGDSARA